MFVASGIKTDGDLSFSWLMFAKISFSSFPDNRDYFLAAECSIILS